MTSPPDETERRKKEMFKEAMHGHWEKVLIYYKDFFAQEARITRSGDSVLHVAVSEGETETVKKLVGLVAKENVKAILGMVNESGNTPLHLAASIGMVEMCKCMVERDDNLILAPNHESETPLFLAAVNGEKEVFLFLHSKCPIKGTDISYCRRKDGDTILHSAIFGEYFDLAFQIIHLYPNLVNYYNERGATALHLLAEKPSSFKSGSHPQRFHHIIYSCTFVDELKFNPVSDATKQKNSENGNVSIPNNYETCFVFFNLLKKIATVLVPGSCMERFCLKDREAPSQGDTEAPPQGNRASEQDNQVVQLASEQGNQRNTMTRLNQASSFTLPANYVACFDLFKLFMKVMLVLLGLGFSTVQEIMEKKQKHTWAFQIMEELVNRASAWEYEDNGRNPQNLQKAVSDIDLNRAPITEDEPRELGDTVSQNSKESPKDDKNDEEKLLEDKRGGKKETPILVAARMGVTELVEKILNVFPVSIQDVNSEGKNVVLLAVENRQPHVYNLILKRKLLRESVFRRLDNEGNSALHLAATMGSSRPWLIPGSALQMQWEIKWYEFVKASMPPHFFVRYNRKGHTPRDIFTATHQQLVEDGGKWLTNTSESCSVVAALIATVAFATAATVPGGVSQETGFPTLENQPAFDVFAISSLVALCFSVTSVVMFLAILTSRYQERDFGRDLPKKLIIGLSSLFVSIAAMLVSFCAGHFFVLKQKLKYASFFLYGVTCLPVTLFAVAQFPLYFDLINAAIAHVPQRSYKMLAF